MATAHHHSRFLSHLCKHVLNSLYELLCARPLQVPLLAWASPAPPAPGSASSRAPPSMPAEYVLLVLLALLLADGCPRERNGYCPGYCKRCICQIRATASLEEVTILVHQQFSKVGIVMEWLGHAHSMRVSRTFEALNINPQCSHLPQSAMASSSRQAMVSPDMQDLTKTTCQYRTSILLTLETKACPSSKCQVSEQRPRATS